MNDVARRDSARGKRGMSAILPPGKDTLIGTVLDGRYRILEVAGTGGMSVVYRASQTNMLGRDVAVKVLHRSFAEMPAVTLRFANEGSIIARLRHPSTLKLFDSGHLDDGRLYFVTEFLPGISLAAALCTGRFSQPRTIGLARQLAGALQEAHDLGIVHRDLNPANIFLDEIGGQEVAKVIDFGIAKSVNISGLTSPMQIFGTPGFISPELLTGQPLDARADIYALGVILYECLAGVHPLRADSLVELLRKHAIEPPIRLSTHVDVAPQLDSLVMRMLEKRPEDRPQTAREAMRELDHIPEPKRAATPHPQSRPALTTLPVPSDAGTSTENFGEEGTEREHVFTAERTAPQEVFSEDRETTVPEVDEHRGHPPPRLLSTSRPVPDPAVERRPSSLVRKPPAGLAQIFRALREAARRGWSKRS